LNINKKYKEFNMLNDADKLYRENLRKKLGLSNEPKVVKEDDIADVNPDLAPVAPKEEVSTSINPDADALFNDVLQFVNELESKYSPRMVKSLWVYLDDNKDKIAKVMVGKSEKSEKAI
jgi:hypothetical protein